MTGGLLQLATVGKEDSILINDPDLFHFKSTYMHHTNFSIDQNSKNYGSKKFGTHLEFNLDKTSDLLKGFYFKVEIPYVQISKKFSNNSTLFTRTESDKIYFDILNSNAYVFNIENDKFLVYPEFLMNVISSTDSISAIDQTEMFGNFLIEISSSEYSKYYDYNSTVINYSKKEDNHNPIIKYLTNRESLWFNIFFNQSKNDNFNVNLMDLKNFYNWLKDKIENKLLYDYHYYYNLSNNYQFYQHNFKNMNNETVNEVFKYIIIKNNNFKLSNFYSNDNLDIDKAISNMSLSNSNLSNDDFSDLNNQTKLLQSVIFPGSFLYFVLKLRYDSSYTNYFSFYHKYIISTSNENAVKGLGNGVYSDLVWDNYFNKFIEESFNNKSKDEVLIYQMNFFNEEKYKTLTNIENLWNTLSIRDVNNEFNIKNIFSIIYTIAFRWKNYTSFETINWNDFLEQSGQIGYFSNIYTNTNLYSTLVLSDIFENYGSDLDFSLIYVHFIYVVTKEFDKLGIFESFPSINKKNIQFLYWCRNKISNMLFIRYKRIVSKELKPVFSAISDSTELINFYYTYINNQSINLNEIKNNMYQIFYNCTYIGMTGSKSHQSSEMFTPDKLDQIAITQFDGSTLGHIKSNFTIDIDQNSYEKVLINGIFYIQIIDNDYFFPNEFTEMRVFYQNYYYDITNYFMNQGFLCFLLDVDISGPFQIEVNLQMPINKYFFNYDTLSVGKNDIEFNPDKSFFSTAFINPDIYNFSFRIIASAFSSPITFISSEQVDSDYRYRFVLNNQSQFNQDLFGSAVTNYSVVLNDIFNYNAVEITTLTHNDVFSLGIKDLEGTVSLGPSDTFYVVYGQKRYAVSIAISAIPGTYVITNLDPTHELLTFSAGTYYLEKQTQILTENNFTLFASQVSVRNVDVTDNNQFLLQLDVPIDASGAISIDNQIYQTSFTFIEPTTAIIDNSDIVSTTFNLQDLSR